MNHSNRYIAHIDIDYFFAQVEELKNKKLKNKAFVVGGEGLRGVVCSSNYIARKIGIKAGLPIFKAIKICPELIVLPTNMELYKEFSQKIFECINFFSSKVEKASIDEAYFDLLDLIKKNNSLHKSGDIVKKNILEKTGLTCSIGIAPNKLLSKISSKINKPNGLFILENEKVNDFLKNLNVKDLFGVGSVTLKKLNELNIFTCKDLQKHSSNFLINKFGKFGSNLYHFCRGIDNRPIIVHQEKKSVSVEKTVKYTSITPNLNNFEECKKFLIELFPLIQKRLYLTDISKVSSYFIKITDINFAKYSICKRNHGLNLEKFILMLQNLYLSKKAPKIRLIGIGVNFHENNCNYRQANLFSQNTYTIC